MSDYMSPEAVARLAERLDDAQCTSGCGTMKFCICAYAANSVDTLRALSAALEAAEMSAKHWHARAKAAEAEQLEQSRLLGISAERELSLRTKLEAADVARMKGGRG